MRERPFLPVSLTSSHQPCGGHGLGSDGVIASARKLIGATKLLEAEPGTIRGDLAINIGRNVIRFPTPRKWLRLKSACGSTPMS